jgi:hypothetical protein
MSEFSKAEMRSLIRKIIIRFSLFPIIFGLIILISAGTFNYWQAYLYLSILMVPMAFVVVYFLKNDPKFLERRTRAKEKEKEQLQMPLFFSGIFWSFLFSDKTVMLQELSKLKKIRKSLLLVFTVLSGIRCI